MPDQRQVAKTSADDTRCREGTKFEGPGVYR